MFIHFFFLFAPDEHGHVEDRGGDDRHLHIHQQRAGRHSVLPARMAVPVGPDQRGGDTVVLLGHRHDNAGADQFPVRISNSFCQHNRVPQLVHVAIKLAEVIRGAAEPSRDENGIIIK